MKKKNIKTYPKNIWLQSDEDEPRPEIWEGVSWCENGCMMHDVEYIRADLTPHAPDITALVEAVDDMKDALAAYKKKRGE